MITIVKGQTDLCSQCNRNRYCRCPRAALCPVNCKDYIRAIQQSAFDADKRSIKYMEAK